ITSRTSLQGRYRKSPPGDGSFSLSNGRSRPVQNRGSYVRSFFRIPGRMAVGRSHQAFEPGENRPFGRGAHNASDEAPGGKTEQRWDRLDVVPEAQFRIVVRVDGDDLEPVGAHCSDTLEDRAQHAAGLAPIGEK